MGRKALTEEIENATAYLAELHAEAGVRAVITPNGSVVLGDDLVFAALPGGGVDLAGLRAERSN